MKNWRVYLCPSGPFLNRPWGPNGLPIRTGCRNSGRSLSGEFGGYGLNCQNYDPVTYPDAAALGFGPGSHRCRSTTDEDIPFPAETAYIVETDRCWFVCGTWHMGYWNPWGQTQGGPNCNACRHQRCDHNGGMNITYADGHTKWIIASDLLNNAALYGRAK